VGAVLWIFERMSSALFRGGFSFFGAFFFSSTLSTLLRYERLVADPFSLSDVFSVCRSTDGLVFRRRCFVRRLFLFFAERVQDGGSKIFNEDELVLTFLPNLFVVLADHLAFFSPSADTSEALFFFFSPPSPFPSGVLLVHFFFFPFDSQFSWVLPVSAPVESGVATVVFFFIVFFFFVGTKMLGRLLSPSETCWCRSFDLRGCFGAISAFLSQTWQFSGSFPPAFLVFGTLRISSIS